MPVEFASTRVASRARKWRTLVVSFSATFLIVGGAIFASVHRAIPASAGCNQYSLTSSTPTTFTDWASAPWFVTTSTGPTSAYPGATNVHDCVTVGSGVEVDLNSSIFALGTMGNSGTIGINSGGTLQLDGASSYTGFGTLKIKGGTLANNTAVTLLNGTLDFEGGTLGGTGNFATSSSGQIQFNGGSGTMNVQQAITAGNANAILLSSPTDHVNLSSPITLSSGSPAMNAAQGQIDYGSAAAAIFINSGAQLNQFSTLGVASIDVPVNNNGTISIANGSFYGLELTRGGTHTGSFSINSNLRLAGAHTFGPASAISSGTGSITVDETTPASTVINFNYALPSTAGFVIPGFLYWNGGTIEGNVIASSAVSMSNASATKTLTKNGSGVGWMTLNAGGGYGDANNTLHIDNSSTLEVTSGNTFSGTSGGTIHSDGTGVLLFDDGSFFDWSDVIIGFGHARPEFTAAYDLDVQPVLKLNGSAQLNNASSAGLTVSLEHGGYAKLSGPNTPQINMQSAGSALVLKGGTFAVDAPSYFNDATLATANAGSLIVAGGTLDLGTSGTLNVPLQLLSGTITNSVANVNIALAKPFVWSGGTWSGTGTTTVNAGATATLAGAVSLTDRQMVNGSGSTFTLNTTAANLTLATSSGANSAGITNNDTFDLAGDGIIAISGAGSTGFTNTGTLKKSGGSGTTTINAFFTGGGTVSSESGAGGSLQFAGGGSMTSGTLNAQNANNSIGIPSGSFAVVNPASMTGLGTLGLSGGTLTVNTGSGTFNATNFKQTGGTLDGSGSLAVSGAFTWAGGSEVSTLGGGHTIVNGTGSIDGTSGVMALDKRILDNAGTTTYTSASNTLDVRNGATINNSGTFDLRTNTPINRTAGAGGFSNSGTLKKTTTTGVSPLAVALNQSAGTTDVQVNSSGIQLNNGGTLTGGSLATSGGSSAVIDFNSGSFGIGNVTSSGSGFLRNFALTSLISNETLTNLALKGGTFSLTAPVTLGITGNLTLDGGVLQSTGTTTVANTGSLTVGSSGSSLVTGGHTLKTFANTAYNATSANYLSVTSSSTFENEVGATLTSNADSNFGGDGTSLFNNLGTVARSGGTFTNYLLPFTNGGTINATVGTTEFSGGGSSSGSITVGASSAIEFGGGNFNVSGGSMTFNATGGMKVIAGNVTLGIATAPPNLLFSGGTITDNGGMTLGTTTTWAGGTLRGSATTINNSTMTITGASTNASLDTHTLTNNGTINYAPSTFSLSLDNGSTVNNAGGGTCPSGAVFDITSDVPIVSAGATPTINNSGTFKKSSGTSTSIAAAIVNTGAVFPLSGTMIFSSFTQTACGTQFATGAGFGATGPITFNGGTLRGSGTISGNLSVGGTAQVLPGYATPSFGIINVNGNYSQSGGTLYMRIAGTASNQFDQVQVTGNASITGGTYTADVSTYTPSNGNTFDVLTYASKSGTDFTTKNLPTFSGGGSMSASYTASALQILATVTQADVTVTQSGPSTVLHGQNDVIVVTVTNTGAPSAAAVTLNDTFSGAAFVSANPSQGTCSGTGPISCSLGTIAGSSSATITLTLNANAIGTITNHATASSTTFDPNTANNDTANTTPYSASVVAASDLSIGITDSPDPVNTGTNVTYTITLSNAGPDNSSAIPFSLTLSGGTLVSATGAGSCSLATTTATCTANAINSGNSATMTVVAQSGTGGTMSLGGTIGYSGDPNTANNTASQSTTINSTSDLGITKSGPASAARGGNVSYTITVTNHGPSDANGVVISDPAPSGLTLSALSGGCASFPCNLGTITNGASKTLTATYTVSASAPGNVTNTASVTSTTTDNVTSNNSASSTTTITCPTAAPQVTFLAASATDVPTSGSIFWNGNGFVSFRVFLGKAGTACNSSTPVATVTSGAYSYSNLDQNTDYEVRIEGVPASACQPVSSSCLKFRTGAICASLLPTPISPTSGSNASPVHFTWSVVPGASGYELFVNSNGSGSKSAGTTTDTFLDANVDDGPASWFVVATVPGCGQITGPAANITMCNLLTAPAAEVVASAASGQSYDVQWPAIPGATKYEIDEAANATFTDATTQTITIPSATFTHSATSTPQAFFYRVRAFTACAQQFSTYSKSVRIVIAPIPPPNQQNTNVNVPAGSTKVVVQQLFIPGFNDGTFNFFAFADKPWLTVQPSSGVLTAAGVTLQVLADPSDLPNGTFTGTVLVTLTPLSTSNAHVSDSGTSVAIPLSVSLVTPVLPTGSVPSATSNTLIIPSVGHLDGTNTHWQSDIRISNTATASQKYTLTFNPSDNSGVKQTNITIDPGATTALDDIVKNWYGVGTLGESGNGVLSIAPITSKLGQQLTSTVASSRTYDVSSTGTLGQYIPAIPFGSFIGKAANNAAATILSLQQVAQSAAYRTNFGIVEGSGQPASVLLSIFDPTGNKLKDLTFDVGPNQQLQLNSLLATNGITLNDGRVEAKVLSGGGKITAYASVVDNQTNDPLLVSGVPLGQTHANTYVLPGVADLKNPFANWQTDMRVFNSSADLQNATLTFYPIGNSGDPMTTTMSINPGEVKTIDNALVTLFGTGAANLGGAVHVTTTTDSTLVVTGRTFNKTDNGGTYGQFIPAFTPADAVGAGGHILQLLQLEDSPRYRTNIGITEVTGKPATVEITVILPDSRVSPKLQLDLGANEFRQSALLSEMGLGNVYNARIAVRVVGGEGKIAAYGSVIDRETQDPTYVPAQ